MIKIPVYFLILFGAASSLLVQSLSTPRVVIVGGGIGGLSSAFDARHILKDTDITVVSERESFQFTPSNPWVGLRKRTPEDISLPLNKILPKHKIEFRHDTVIHLDPEKQQLKLKDDKGGGSSTLDYDYLIIATGPRLAFEEIPGMGPKGHSESICTTPHASQAADAVDTLIANPGPVVIGAVQGASCFGPAYEFALLLNHELYKRGGKNLVEQCKQTFITPEPYIGHLGLDGAGESQKILEKLFTERGIDWITNCSVKKVTSESVAIEYLEEQAESKKYMKKTKTLPSKFNMLIPPFRGAKVWKSVPGLTDKNGMVVVNEFQQSVKYAKIFGVGVCVHLDALAKTPVPTGAPKTGYMIESMGTAAVNNIKDMIQYEANHKDEPMQQLHHKPSLNGLCITDFGDDGAIFLTLPQLPPRRTDITIDGRIATLAKIAFEKYFLYKVETGDTDPYYEKYMLHLIGVDREAKI